jgi:hypothetical protein
MAQQPAHGDPRLGRTSQNWCQAVPEKKLLEKPLFGVEGVSP